MPQAPASNLIDRNSVPTSSPYLRGAVEQERKPLPTHEPTPHPCRRTRGSAASTPGIRIPYAVSRAGEIIHIKDYRKRVHRCVCLDPACGQPLVGKQGDQLSWHFAHKGESCSGEGALHYLAKQFTKQGFDHARAAGIPYVRTWTCPRCGDIRKSDCTSFVNSVTVESRIAAGTQADVAFHAARPFAVEVVVSHDLEPQTLARYKAAGTPVFVVYPGWRTVGDLRSGLVAIRAFHIECALCGWYESGSVDEIESPAVEEPEAESERPERECIRQYFAARMVWPSKRIFSWERDATGRRLSPELYWRLAATGRDLTRLGFRQSRLRRWEFGMALPNSWGTVIVELGRSQYGHSPGPRSPFVRLCLNGASWLEEIIREQLMSHFGRLGVTPVFATPVRAGMAQREHHREAS